MEEEEGEIIDDYGGEYDEDSIDKEYDVLENPVQLNSDVEDVLEFMKKISYRTLSKKGIDKLGPAAITLAKYEGLAGLAQAIIKRIRRK